jgi:putative membrane protein
MKRILVIAALLAATHALAGTPKSGTGTPSTPSTPTDTTGTPTGTTGMPTDQTGMGQPGMGQAVMDDGNVVAVLMASNDIEVQNGELARMRSQNSDVKAFAERMVAEHQSINTRVKDLTTRLKLNPQEGDVTKRLRADADTAMTGIRAMKGADFDRAYIEQEIAFHTRVLEMIDTQMLPNVKGAELKSLVNEVRPTFQAHLTHARQVQQKLKAPA